MENIDYDFREVEVPIHKFYCDDCGEYLGESEEYDDGYYVEKGEYNVEFNFDHWYTLEKCLCEKCAEKKNNQIFQALKDLGFKLETHCRVIDKSTVNPLFYDDLENE